jgi:hypothetical protein
MGLFKKLQERAAAAAPDFFSLVSAELPQGETLLALGQGQPLVQHGDVGGRGLAAYAVNKASQAVKIHSHEQGVEGSCAKSILSQAQSFYYAAITNKHLSIWDLGDAGDQTPRQTISFPHASVRSIEPRGAKSSYGLTEMRFSFVDDSFLDLNVYDLGGFDSAASGLRN